MLDLLMPNGQWLPVRYEIAWYPFAAEFIIGIGPAVKREGEWEARDEATLRVDLARAVFRWPEYDLLGHRPTHTRTNLVRLEANENGSVFT